MIIMLLMAIIVIIIWIIKTIPSLEFSVACCHSLARPDPVLEEEQMSLAFLDNSADNDDDDENDGDDYDDDDLQMCNTERHIAPSPPAS